MCYLQTLFCLPKLRLILKLWRKKRTGIVTTSAEARYTSGSNTVTITKSFLNNPTPSKPTPHTPPKPNMKGRPTQAPKTVKMPPPRLECHSNPSYSSHAFYDDNTMYEELDTAVRAKEKYGGEYECI